MKILFLHGTGSKPGDVRASYLKNHGHEVLNPALPDDDFDDAVRIAQAEYDEGHPDVVVGSSRGGAVAMNINSGDTPLVLLCPAWKAWGIGNHDKEIRPRGSKPPEEPVYDINATAFRRFFELPGDEWKWHFDIPDFDVRFVALDLNHISDFGTTWQACHSFKKDRSSSSGIGK
jgi:hypothetical protein